MKNKLRSKEGFALFSVLFIIAALSLMLGMLIQIGGQRAYTARRLVNQVKAVAYAEAGIDYAYSILATDFDQRDNPAAFLLGDAGGSQMFNDMSESQALALNSNNDGVFSLMMGQSTSSYSTGSFSITLTSISNKYVIINSVGQCGDASAVAEIVVNDENAGSGGNTPTVDYSNMEGLKYAILSGGTFDFSGCGTISSPGGQALFHSNGEMTLRGNVDALIDLSTSGTIKTKGNTTIEGSLTEDAPNVPIPDIDLTPFYNWALDHGEVHDGFTTTTDITPAGGILWVNGDFHISAQATIHGSVIATGDINLSGQIDVEPTTCAFSVVSRDGDIHVTSGGTIEGLMYAKTGDLQHTANGEIVGQVIINGNIKKAGNSDIMTGYSQSIPTPPGTPSDTETIAWPVVSAWQK